MKHLSKIVLLLLFTTAFIGCETNQSFEESFKEEPKEVFVPEYQSIEEVHQLASSIKEARLKDQKSPYVTFTSETLKEKADKEYEKIFKKVRDGELTDPNEILDQIKLKEKYINVFEYKGETYIEPKYQNNEYASIANESGIMKINGKLAFIVDDQLLLSELCELKELEYIDDLKSESSFSVVKDFKAKKEDLSEDITIMSLANPCPAGIIANDDAAGGTTLVVRAGDKVENGNFVFYYQARPYQTFVFQWNVNRLIKWGVNYRISKNTSGNSRVTRKISDQVYDKNFEREWTLFPKNSGDNIYIENKFCWGKIPETEYVFVECDAFEYCQDDPLTCDFPEGYLCEGVTCNSGFICVDGECVVDNSGNNNCTLPCGPNERCVNGTCVPI